MGHAVTQFSSCFQSGNGKRKSWTLMKTNVNHVYVEDTIYSAGAYFLCIYVHVHEYVKT